MLPCLSKRLSETYLIERISAIVECDLCHVGFFREDKHFCCFTKAEVRKIENVRIVEFVKVDLFCSKKEQPKKEIEEKVEKIKKIVRRECLVCGDLSGTRMCCSNICQKRWDTRWYGENGVKYISVKKIVGRLIKNKIKKENKKLKYDKGNQNI